MNQPSKKDQSQVDPQQFQNLFDQMQNNHDFLEKMQGILAMYPLTTESSDDNSSFNLQKTQTLNRLSTLNEELMKSQTPSQMNLQSQNLIQQPTLQLQRADTLQPTYTKETMEYTPTPSNKQNTLFTPISYQVDSQAKNLFQEQFINTDQKFSQPGMNITPINNIQENEYNPKTPIQQPNLGVFQNQQQNQFDPSQMMISPEYFQMFNQFYQMFMQVQAATQIDLSNDPMFLQNMMVQYFTFMTQNGGMGSPTQGNNNVKSPRNIRDYNNLPLAAIPESKDSILEENSGWGTVRTNKLGQLMSVNSAITKDNQCNCCANCQEIKNKGVFQQCSNFNIGQFQAFQNQSQINQETFIQKSDISSAANSQILNNPFGLGSLSPSPHHIQQPIDIQNKYATATQLVYQNLSNVFQINQNQQPNLSVEPSFNIQSHYQSRKESCQSNQEELQNLHNLETYLQNQPNHLLQGQFNQIDLQQTSQFQNQDPSPTNNIESAQLQDQILLSPQQIQQNKLIEYMIDNNDFSNYKQRREVIKGERISRTLSRSNSKNTTIQWYHQQKLSLQNSNIMMNNNHTQRFSNHFQQLSNGNFQMQNYFSNNDEYNMNENNNQQQFFSDYKQIKLDNYASQGLLQEQDSKALMFFSPQVTNKQQCYVYKSTLEDVISGDDNEQNKFNDQEKIQILNFNEYDRDNVTSPQAQRLDRQQQNGNNQQTQKRKKTSEKIKEIRRLNELQRGKEQLKKSTTRKNLHKQPQKNVFEIKDLKKSQSRKNAHFRKQSQNIVSNKENNKLIQSNYQNNYEMSQQHILLSPNQDPLIVSIDQECRKKDSNTFKSLNSVANGRFSSSNHQQIFDIENQSSPQITNLKLKLDNMVKNTALIQPFEHNIVDTNQILQDKVSHLNLNQLLDENRKPGQEIHIIKKPVQTEEFKKIQERLNKYYSDKRKDEVQIKQDNQHQQNAQYNRANQQNYQQNDYDAMSMTKTLSSFKSLMMKTMSQMSMQQETNIANQFMQGKDQRKRVSSKMQGSGVNNHYNQSVNVSSIQDDFSVGVDYSDNLTKIISPKNLYNGSLANIKQRNYNHQEIQQSEIKYQEQQKQVQEPQSNNKQQCLPNSLFFKQNGNPNQQHQLEDTLSLKYSRPPSVCYCGKSNCFCGQDSKKDLLSHFQNFLQEMDKHPQLNNQGMGIYKESIFQSPIENLRHSNSTNDFLMTNFNFLNAGRSSSLNSRLSRPKGMHSNRQSSITASTNNLIGQPKLKRFSSGTTLTNLPLKKINNNLNHCQSTQVFPHLKKISLDSDNQTSDRVIKQIQEVQQNSDGISNSPSKLTVITQDQLEKLDTNKEEEIRLLNIENDIMHKAFLQKSHRLNLQDNQRNELLQRIQQYKKVQQQANVKNNSGVSSTMHDEGIYSQNMAVGSTQNTSHVTGLGYGSHYNSGNHSINQQQQQHNRRQSDFSSNQGVISNVSTSMIGQGNINPISLEERRKMEKYKKKAESIIQTQNQRENEIKYHQQQYGFM